VTARNALNGITTVAMLFGLTNKKHCTGRTAITTNATAITTNSNYGHSRLTPKQITPKNNATVWAHQPSQDITSSNIGSFVVVPIIIDVILLLLLLLSNCPYESVRSLINLIISATVTESISAGCKV